MNRDAIAMQVASGLAGWYQLQVVQRIDGLSGEDTARSVIAQIINAQGKFAPATSQLPPNWSDTKRRVDIALLGRSAGSIVWYGAIEVKWPGSAFDAHQVRQHIVQDAMRLAFIDTNGINAKFLVVGGSVSSLDRLFRVKHPGSTERENRRLAFRDLLSRDLNNCDRELVHDRWSLHFPEAGERIPKTPFNGFDGKLKTKLLAKGVARVGTDPVGGVFIWQCSRTRGTAIEPR